MTDLGRASFIQKWLIWDALVLFKKFETFGITSLYELFDFMMLKIMLSKDWNNIVKIFNFSFLLH